MNSNKPAPRTEVKLADVPIKMIVDTGASVNILNSRTYDHIKTAIPLKPTATKVYPYGTDKPLPLLGETTMPVESKAKITVAKFYVAKDGKTPLLSYETAKELGLIRIMVAVISADDDTLTAEQITKEYPKLFQGLRKLCHWQVRYTSTLVSHLLRNHTAEFRFTYARKSRLNSKT